MSRIFEGIYRGTDKNIEKLIMAGIRDLDSGKVYIGQEEPKLDKSTETLNGDKPFEGTLAVTGPLFIGNHGGGFAKGVANFGTTLGDFKPGVSGRAIDISGDVYHAGNKEHIGNVEQTGNLDQTGNIDLTGSYTSSGAITISGKVTCGSLASGLPKAFDIPHPNIDGYRLHHACPEGPEAAIYVRGKVSIDGIIELPDYWQNFVDKETITVQLTPIGAYQELFIDRIEYGKRVYVKNQAGGKIDAYYQVWANRADVSFDVEYPESDDHAHYRTTDI